MAIDEAKAAASEGEVPVGAVVVKDGEVISSAHNLCENEKNSLLHAEIIAIDRAMKVLGTSRLDGCDLYVTLEPCAMCCGAIAHARISRLYFGAYDRDCGCVVSNLYILDSLMPGRIECYCGINEDKCSKLLTDFFRRLRENLSQ